MHGVGYVAKVEIGNGIKLINDSCFPDVFEDYWRASSANSATALATGAQCGARRQCPISSIIISRAFGIAAAVAWPELTGMSGSAAPWMISEGSVSRDRPDSRSPLARAAAI